MARHQHRGQRPVLHGCRSLALVPRLRLPPSVDVALAVRLGPQRALRGLLPCRGHCRWTGPLVRSPHALSRCILRSSTADQAHSRSARSSGHTRVRIACGTGRGRHGQIGKPPVGRANGNSTPPTPQATIDLRRSGATRGAIRLQPGRPSRLLSPQHPAERALRNFSTRRSLRPQPLKSPPSRNRSSDAGVRFTATGWRSAPPPALEAAQLKLGQAPACSGSDWHDA